MAVTSALFAFTTTTTTAFVPPPTTSLSAVFRQSRPDFPSYSPSLAFSNTVIILSSTNPSDATTDQSNATPHQAPPQAIAFELDFGGNSVPIELSSADDIPMTAQQLASQFACDPQDIQQVLQQTWDAASTTTSGGAVAAYTQHPPPYQGPIATPTDEWKAERTIELPSGLIVELGPSTIGEAAGLGVFVRQSTNAAAVLQTQGSAFCGYGPCDSIRDSLDGLTAYQRQRTFEFILPDSLESYVWFDSQLVTIWDALQQSQATGVRSHILDQTDNGELFLTPDAENPCYLIPPADPLDTQSITIQTIGHMCNDLAGGKVMSKEEYDAESEAINLLVLVPRVAKKENGLLEPSGMPILTLAKTVVVANTESSMEVGLRYGQAYWSDEQQAM